ncbi:MAG: hypothetical protein ABIN97_11080 [Ginsengibacter sp.]
MKHLYSYLLATILGPVILLAQNKPEFVNYTQGGLNAPEFTTNNFKCIAVGKGNVIWAGTQYGGLYKFDDSFKVWTKSSQLTNVFINDIKADPDSGIWIAQSGLQSFNTNNTNIAGGVNYFPDQYEVNMRFFSVEGTTTGADLLSRNVRSLYLDPSYKAARNQLPRLWVAQAPFITSFKTKRGGLSIGLNDPYSPPYPKYFTNQPEGFSSNSSATPLCEAVGGDNKEIWIGVRQNGGNSQILRYTPDGKWMGNPNPKLGFYDHDSVPLLPSGFIAQAIFCDAVGNRWIGMKSGGLVIKTPNGWVKMDATSKIPPGTAINFNAIAADEYGNVYIGTSSGLLEYLSPDFYPSSSPDNINSYNLYTDADGLPSNNITGIAYDKKNGKILITSSGGVTFMNKREPFIKGVVYDVFCSIDSSNNYAGLQKLPLKGAVTIKLLKDGVEKEFAFPDASGTFELKQAEDNKLYTVEVSFKSEGKEMKYVYNDIRNHTLMLPVLMPDSLIRELKAFRPKMENRCFTLKLPFLIELSSLVCVDGFNLTGYELAYEPFYDPASIKADHKKKVDNLANYYAALATVYSLGGSSTDLNSDMIANAIDAIELMTNFEIFASKVKDKVGTETDPFAELGETLDQVSKLAVSSLRLLKEGVVSGLNLVSSSLGAYPQAKSIFDKSITCINEASDLSIDILEQGGKGAGKKAIFDNAKKLIATSAASQFYKYVYTDYWHKNFVYNASNSSKHGVSKFTYNETYDNLFNPNANSIAKYANDTLVNRKATIELLSKTAKVADAAAGVLDAATALALVPGGQVAAAIAKGLATVAKGIKITALAGTIYQGAIGSYEVIKLSEKITPDAGLLRGVPGSYKVSNPASPNSPATLLARKNSYNQKLTDLQAVYNASVYSATTYGTKYKEFAKEDSLYTDEMIKTLNGLWASTDSAIILIPGFENKLRKVIDSFVVQQYTIRHALYYQNLAYIFDTDKSPYKVELNNLANQIKTLNDSAINGITNLVNDINTKGISAPPFLVQESYKLNHNHVPGSSGSVVYTFKNYGAQPQNNVSFKISPLTAGYVLTSADSINVGTIQPGEVKQISFSFNSPITDSLCHYIIDVNASNGNFKDVSGSLYVIDPAKFYSVKDGNWSDPATWSDNIVPTGNNSVVISHIVTVDVNANCKSIEAIAPGTVRVNTGKHLNVLK